MDRNFFKIYKFRIVIPARTWTQNFCLILRYPTILTQRKKIKLQKCLQSHLDLFVSDENPDLGYTEVVQHKISLKPDYHPKYHKPYRLPPDKKEALRKHLDELLRQNIIAPVHESESVPITSPIVLVSKRNKAKKNSENQLIKSTKRLSLTV